MTETTHLTNDLQAELNKMSSAVKLQTDNNSVVKMNYKDWAWATVDSRTIQASTYVGLDEKHLQLEESGIIACSSSTKDILEMATIIDKWLGNKFDIFQLEEQHKNIKVNKHYRDLKTLSIDEILEGRWTYLKKEIAKGRISFRMDVFESFRKHFSRLYPIFSHDNLLFSNLVEQMNDDFKSPIVFCNKDIIWVGFFRDNSKEEGEKTFRTKDIGQAVEMTSKLLPNFKYETINPLKN